MVGLEPLRVEFAPNTQEPLAQGPGHFIFDFDAAHRPIDVLGMSELGTEVEDFKAGSPFPSGIEVKSRVCKVVGRSC